MPLYHLAFDISKFDFEVDGNEDSHSLTICILFALSFEVNIVRRFVYLLTSQQRSTV